MKINKAFKFRVYPSIEQIILINQTIGCSRLVYNYMLDRKENNKSLSKYDLFKLLPRLKEEKEFLKDVDSTALQNSIADLDNAYKRYYNKLGGKPNFKKKGIKDSFRTNCNYSIYKGKRNSSIEVDLISRTIKLPKLGTIPIRGYRNLKEFPYKIFNATISKEADKYYVSVCVEMDIDNNSIKTNNAVGIDVGVKSLVVTSDFEEYGNVVHLTKYEKKIKKLQQKLSKQVKGSNNYYKTKMKLKRTYMKLANARKKQVEEIVSKLTKENDYIFAEKLNVKEMIEDNNKSLTKKIINSTFGLIFTKLEFKCIWLGKVFYQVDTYYPSSQICCNCGYKNKEMKDLSKRVYKCKNCNNELDRDINASINILTEGIEKVIFNS